MKMLFKSGWLARTIAALALIVSCSGLLGQNTIKQDVPAVPGILEENGTINGLPNDVPNSVPEPTGIVAALVAGMFVASGFYMNRRKK